MGVTNDEQLVLGEEDARDVCLIEAFETVDRTGVLIPRASRLQATTEARAAGEARVEQWLPVRARTLRSALASATVPSLGTILRWTQPGRGLMLPVVLLAVVIGLLTNALGPSRQIHILALPLLGIIIWNLAALALLAARRWLPSPPRVPWLLDLLQRSGRWATRRTLAVAERRAEPEGGEPDGAPDETALTTRALQRFSTAWATASAPLAVARIRRLLHVGSLALTVGVVAGMYLRGVAFDYRATWESTFLSPAIVQTALEVILGPAAAILGTPVPAVSALRDVPGPAAPWIHLWALTALLLVGVPRAVLILIETARVARRRRHIALPVAAGYRRRMLAAVDPSRRRVDIVPYSYQPSSQGIDKLKRLLHDLFGPRATIRVRASLAYGDEPSTEPEPDAADCRIVLFTLAQTPEREVHGELLTTLRDATVDGRTLLALIDGGVHRRRLGAAADDERLVGRRTAWDHVAHEARLTPYHVDLEQGFDQAAPDQLLALAWPEGSLGALGEGRR